MKKEMQREIKRKIKEKIKGKIKRKIKEKIKRKIGKKIKINKNRIQMMTYQMNLKDLTDQTTLENPVTHQMIVILKMMITKMAMN